jgi:hypothetical protein
MLSLERPKDHARPCDHGAEARIFGKTMRFLANFSYPFFLRSAKCFLALNLLNATIAE